MSPTADLRGRTGGRVLPGRRVLGCTADTGEPVCFSPETPSAGVTWGVQRAPSGNGSQGLLVIPEPLQLPCRMQPRRGFPCPIPRAPQVLEAVLWGALVENWLTSRVLQNGSWPGELRSASQVSFLSLGPHCPPHCLTGEGGCQSHTAGVAPSTHSPRFCLEGPWRNRVRGPQPQ